MCVSEWKEVEAWHRHVSSLQEQHARSTEFSHAFHLRCDINQIGLVGWDSGRIPYLVLPVLLACLLAVVIFSLVRNGLVVRVVIFSPVRNGLVVRVTLRKIYVCMPKPFPTVQTFHEVYRIVSNFLEGTNFVRKSEAI